MNVIKDLEDKKDIKEGFMRHRVGILFLVLTMVLLGLTACYQEDDVNESPEEALPYVELNMYLVGEQPEDTSLVYDELNKMIKSELNAKLNVHFISWQELENKYSQVLSSGISADLIYTADWCYYDSEARKGTLREITLEDIETYMPQTFNSQNKESFEQSMINGAMFMVPNYQKEYADYKLVLIRGDLREKYGISPLETFEDYEDYLSVIAENEENIVPYKASMDNKELTYIGFWQANGLVRINSDNKASSFAIRYEESETDYDLINILETDSYLEYLYEMREWYELGYWEENAIANTAPVKSAFENGQSASLAWNIGTLNLSMLHVLAYEADWQPEIYELTEGAPVVLAKFTNNGMAVANKSLNYERSLMLLDKLKNDERYWNLTWLGIEGVHWESMEGGYYSELEESYKYPYAYSSCWGWGNEPFQRLADGTPDVINTLVSAWEIGEIVPKTHLFRFNDDQVREETAACIDILSHYQPILELGLVEDVEGTYYKMLEALHEAGWEIYENEFRRQYQIFLEEEGIEQ